MTLAGGENQEEEVSQDPEMPVEAGTGRSPLQTSDLYGGRQRHGGGAGNRRRIETQGGGTR